MLLLDIWWFLHSTMAYYKFQSWALKSISTNILHTGNLQQTRLYSYRMDTHNGSSVISIQQFDSGTCERKFVVNCGQTTVKAPSRFIPY